MSTKRWRVTAALICLVFLQPAALIAARVEFDTGTIEGISDGRVVVQTARGKHILEYVRECTWCEEGMEVVVKFTGYGRATIRPKKQYFTARPLPVLVIRDGREEE